MAYKPAYTSSRTIIGVMVSDSGSGRDGREEHMGLFGLRNGDMK